MRLETPFVPNVLNKPTNEITASTAASTVGKKPDPGTLNLPKGSFPAS
jgi:hypothetical protein